MKINTSFKSNYAILDVKKGRAALARKIVKGEKIKVYVEMILDTQSSHDDGTSIEFSGEVISLKYDDPKLENIKKQVKSKNV